MAINPKTLKALRKRLGFSQQALADKTRSFKGGAVSKRQIGRIEFGETAPEGVRRHTAESLAKALNTTVDGLAGSADEALSHDTWQWQAGFRPKTIKAVVLPGTPLSYQLVQHHYGISLDHLIDAAPWMFTLLAELSLASRKQRLEAIDDALEQTMSDHLRQLVSSGLGDAYEVEEKSILERDVFGAQLPIEFDVTNPLVEYLKDLALSAKSDAIDPDQCVSFPESRTCWPIFEGWCERLTNGDTWARHAMDHGHVRIEEIPEELMSENRGIDRAAWLAAKVPAEGRALIEQDDQERRRREREMATSHLRVITREER